MPSRERGATNGSVPHTSGAGCAGGVRASALPPDPADIFSEGGEAIKLHIGGSLTIPTAGIKQGIL